MADQRRAGLIQLQIQGVIYDAKGKFSTNLGRPKRATIIGADGVHGYKEEAQASFIEGAITDRGNLDLNAIVTASDITITMSYANGKTFVLRDAWFASEGSLDTDEAEIAVRWEGIDAEEIPA